MEELILGGATPPKHSVWDNYTPIVTNGRHTDVYLTSNIETPDEYNELCHKLNAAFTGDTITLHINNGGGYLDSAFYIISALKNTKATVTAELSGTVASASTVIALKCDKVIAVDYLQFMIHNYSSASSGKGHEMKLQMEFTDAQLNKTFGEIYGGFLTPHEMELVIAGKDLWMGTDEVLARLDARKQGNNEALEKIEEDRKNGKL